MNCDITMIERAWCSHCTGALLPEEPRETDDPVRFPSFDTLEAKATRRFITAVKAERRRETAKGYHG